MLPLTAARRTAMPGMMRHIFLGRVEESETRQESSKVRGHVTEVKVAS